LLQKIFTNEPVRRPALHFHGLAKDQGKMNSKFSKWRAKPEQMFGVIVFDGMLHNF